MHLNRTASGLLAGALLLSTASGVFAASGQGKPHLAVAVGQVTGLTGTAFTLSRTNKKTNATTTFAVTTGTATKERALKGTTGALADGEYAVVVGVESQQGAITANQVVYSTTAKPLARVAKLARLRVAIRRYQLALWRRAAGTVQSYTPGATLSITNKNGKTLTFAISSTTRYRVDGQKAGAPASLSGTVRVIFKRDATVKTQLDALAIIVPVARS